MLRSLTHIRTRTDGLVSGQRRMCSKKRTHTNKSTKRYIKLMVIMVCHSHKIHNYLNAYKHSTLHSKVARLVTSYVCPLWNAN